MLVKAPYFLGCFFILYEVPIQGIIFKIISKDYYVRTAENGIYRCSLRGKFKKELQFKNNKLYTFDVAVIGDSVHFQKTSDDAGVIEMICERKNYLSRKAIKGKGALKRGERLEQIIAANLDALFIVSSIDRPKFNNKFLDRVLVSAESCGLKVNIIINKIDLDNFEKASYWEQLYSDIGYNVIITSAVTGVGVKSIMDELKDNTNIFWGQSGVGKSTLLNKMYPELQLNVGEVSESSNKGTHTTVTGEMFNVDENTYIIDTPGIRELDPYGLKEQDLSHYFIEFLPYLQDCKFNTCTHNHEPGCNILTALEEGKISLERYDSYLNMLNSIEEGMFY